MDNNWTDGVLIRTEKICERFELSSSEVEAFKEYIRIYKEGVDIVSNANRDDNLYLLRVGKVDVHQQGEEDEQQLSIKLSPTCFFNSLMLSDKKPGRSFIKAASSEVLVYALPESVLPKMMADQGWRETMLRLLLNDLSRVNRDRFKVMGKFARLKGSHKALKNQVQRMGDEQEGIAQAAKVFSTVLKLIDGIKESVTVTSRAWYYLDTLDNQIIKLLERYAPNIARNIGEPDPKMLKSCLKRGTTFLKQDSLQE